MSFRFLALGDSYTIGERVAENECWPNQLAELIKSSLQFRETEGGAKVTILARTGWTTAELWQGIQTAKLEPPYDLVSLLIGVNNQYRDLALDDYRSEFANLVAQSVKFAGANPQRVIVLSIPDWSVTPFAEGRDRAQIAAEIDAFNAVNREQSARLLRGCDSRFAPGD
jgi:lysophospholipase L1-like esterase